MADEKPKLRCDKCGKPPTPDQVKWNVAKAGGTHYRELTHGAGIPGRESQKKLRTCGTWVEVKP